uniref:ABC transporter domain-containing protein n=1 Tax=Biomphalaria glabrata TaxID=6526 RepID=A0A2C9L8E6_BIOGL
MLDIALKAKSKAKALRINDELIHRDLNVGFSGGEKKKIEILQMEMLKPKFIMLDEIDSGLDVDAIKAIASQINESKRKDNTMVIISHYKELYEQIQPDKVLIIKDGKLFAEGDYSLLMQTLEKGFD